LNVADLPVNQALDSGPSLIKRAQLAGTGVEVFFANRLDRRPAGVALFLNTTEWINTSGYLTDVLLGFLASDAQIETVDLEPARSEDRL
jgi:hypothetical protein